VHADYLDAIDSIRAQWPAVEVFVVLEGGRDGWLNYEQTIGESPAAFRRFLRMISSPSTTRVGRLTASRVQ
jgi:hypothetical protein